jgi:hypothetical protein
MKKHVRKLRLHRETLRYLQATQIGAVQGGANTHELNTGCACTVGCGGTGGGTGGGGTGGGGTGTCGCSGTACGTGNTHEFISGCATNCG